MTGAWQQRLARWVQLAGREIVDIDGGFEIVPDYRVTLGDGFRVEHDGAFDFSSHSIEAVERWLVLRLGVDGRVGSLPALKLPWSVTDLPPQFVFATDREHPDIWVLELQDRTEVARIRRDAAVEFSTIAEADPELVRQSLLDPDGTPLFAVPAAPQKPLPVPAVAESEPHTRRRQCPGPYRSQCEEVSLGNWEFLVRCMQCGALFSIGLADYSGVIPLSTRKARKRFPEAVL